MTGFDDTYEWLNKLFPDRARPVGFYPLPSIRADIPFDPAWISGMPAVNRRQLLYVHVPFCEQRCGYCRFYPGPASKGIEDDFLYGAIAQLQWWAQTLAQSQTSPVQAVFFGGGSPSALSPRALRTVMDAVQGLFQLAPQAEITMEWFPSDSAPDKLEAAVQKGVSRFSVGAQSWNPKTLRALGCHHTPEAIDSTLNLFEKYGISNFNIDLMCNVPGQDIESHLDDVRRAADGGAAMISTNILELAAGTPFNARGGAEDTDPVKRRWLRQISQMMGHLDFSPQRTRNFYRGERFHQYNRFCTGVDFDIIPVGPGAYGYVAGMPLISNPDRALWRDASGAGAIAGYSLTSQAELRRAFVANSLLELMIDAEAYRRTFASDLFDDFPILAASAEQQVLIPDNGLWQLAPAGIEFADDIIVSIFSESQRQLFDRHLRIGRSRSATQYFPLLSAAAKGDDRS